LKQSELLDLVERAYKEAPPTSFPSVQEALLVAGCALRYLTDQCEDEDDSEEVRKPERPANRDLKDVVL
jgi:hypothetical protein